MSVIHPVLRDGNGSPVMLAGLLAEGGEAKLLAVGDQQGRIAKIFHKPAAGRAARIARLLAQPARESSLLPGHRSLIWPDGILLDHAGALAGVILDYVEQAHPLSLAIAPRLRRQHWPWADWRHLISLGATLAGLVARLHRQGFVLGDLKPDNILLDKAMRPSLVDCDSFLPPHWNGPDYPVASEGYAAPENWRDAAEGGLRRDIAGDRFALAVVLGELLLGRRPGADWYRGHPDATICGDGFGILMRRALTGEATQRPVAEEWRAELCAMLSRAVACRAKPQHRHLANQPCPWCRLEAESGVEIFPSPPVLPDSWESLRLAWERALILGEADAARAISEAACSEWRGFPPRPPGLPD